MTVSGSETIELLAFKVCTVLDDAGTVAVLTGGGAATVYAAEAISTLDLDFVIQLWTNSHQGAQALAKPGFAQRGRSGIYEHPKVVFTVEFPEGPLSFGDRVVTTWDTLRKDEMLLHIISPSDSVCDRLAAAIHWHDKNSLRQAALVAGHAKVDLDYVRDWCEAEGGLKVYEQFMSELSSV